MYSYFLVSRSLLNTTNWRDFLFRKLYKPLTNHEVFPPQIYNLNAKQTMVNNRNYSRQSIKFPEKF